MIGDVVRQQVARGRPRVSTSFRDAVLDRWREARVRGVPTLNKQRDIWKEFWLYASDTKNWCPRLCALRAFHDAQRDELDAETLWSFEQGNAYHRLFQEHLFASLGSDFLGAWERMVPVFGNMQDVLRRLRSGYPDDLYDLKYRGYSDERDSERRHIVRAWGPPPVGYGWRYVESKVRMLDQRIVVKFDGILRLCGVLEVEEVKTARDHQRDRLDPMLGGGPVQAHVEQLMLAMWATGIRKGRLIYLFKGAQSFSTALLEHELVYDADMVERLKEVAVKCVDAVKLCDKKKEDGSFDSDEKKTEWIDENFPRYDECPMKSKGRARTCPGRDLCFQKRKMSKDGEGKRGN